MSVCHICMSVCLSVSVCLSLSLSLSHTHTHVHVRTHVHARTHRLQLNNEQEILPLGKIWVQRRLLEVSLIVTWDGSKGLISARPGRRILVCDCTGLLGDPALPTTGRYGGDVSVSGASFWMANALCFTAKQWTAKNCFSLTISNTSNYKFWTRDNAHTLHCGTFVWPLLPSNAIYSLLGGFAKLQKVTISFVMSVRLHETTQLPLDRFSWNLILQYFLKICHKNSSFIKIWQE